jgi:hypothetical protein
MSSQEDGAKIPTTACEIMHLGVQKGFQHRRRANAIGKEFNERQGPYQGM